MVQPMSAFYHVTIYTFDVVLKFYYQFPSQFFLLWHFHTVVLFLCSAFYGLLLAPHFTFKVLMKCCVSQLRHRATPSFCWAQGKGINADPRSFV